MQQEIKDNFIVSQSNSLIDARYSNPLNKNELKIILAMISNIQPTDEDFKEYTMKYSTFCNLIGLTDSKNHAYIKKVAKTLMSRVIEIPLDEKNVLLTHWVSSCELQYGVGLIKLSFDPKLKPFLLNLKTAFTRYQLSNILSLESTFSIRLYEILKKNEFKHTFVVDVDSLKRQLGAIKPTYEKYSQFKRAILDKSIEENNKKTDIVISYEEIKVGKKVVSIQFTVEKKKQNKIIKQLELPSSNESESNEQAAQSSKFTSSQMTDLEYEFFHFLVVLSEHSELKIKENTLYSMFLNGLQIWNTDYDRTIRELVTLLVYAENEKSIINPIGFVLSEIKNALTQKESSKVEIGELGVVDNEMLPTFLTSKYTVDQVPILLYYTQIEEKINKRFNQYKINNNQYAMPESEVPTGVSNVSSNNTHTLLADYEAEMKTLLLGGKLLTEEGYKRYKELEKLVDEIKGNEKSLTV